MAFSSDMINIQSYAAHTSVYLFTKMKVITRLMRYFPDLTWETANDIVETAFVNDVALVRIVNSVVSFRYFSIVLVL